MSHYVEGFVDGSRRLQFNFSPVFAGEQNNNILKIDISQWTGIVPDYYLISCETSPVGEVFISAPITELSDKIYVEEGYIYCPLSYRMTETGLLKIQISAYKSEEQGIEIIEKTSVARLEFAPSLGAGRELVTYDDTVWSRLCNLEDTVNGLCSFTEEFSFDYFAAALAARLLFTDSVETPVYFPSTAERAEEIITEKVTEPDEECSYVLVVVPSTQRSRAALCVITPGNGVAQVNLYSGRELLDFLRGGITDNE